MLCVLSDDATPLPTGRLWSRPTCLYMSTGRLWSRPTCLYIASWLCSAVTCLRSAYCSLFGTSIVSLGWKPLKRKPHDHPCHAWRERVGGLIACRVIHCRRQAIQHIRSGKWSRLSTVWICPRPAVVSCVTSLTLQKYALVALMTKAKLYPTICGTHGLCIYQTENEQPNFDCLSHVRTLHTHKKLSSMGIQNLSTLFVNKLVVG